MKKQLFGVKKKMKSRRQRRSFLSSLLNADWIFGQSEGNNGGKEKERTQRQHVNQSKVNTLREITKKGAKDIPSDFFK